MEEILTKLDPLIEPAITYGSKLLLALVVLAVGWWLVGRLMSAVDASMKKTGVEVTLRGFIKSLIGGILKVVLVIIFASMVGVETASLIALLGAAGLAIGLALQGSLANFAGGVLILFFRPFKAGDVIDAQGYVGHVEEIQIFNTIMRTLDNQRVIIPNGLLSNGCVKNVFAEPTRRVDLTFGISYDDDLLKAKAVIRTVIAADDRILKDPEADVFISAHADSSVNILVRPWVNSEDYWAVHFSMMEEVKLAFDRENITIPYPQRDVHFYQPGA
ncbi:mechanosensitive ion channel [Halieaceae bacterium IMCC14734]|uniref:Small-conductance mechanosensitive channel n=1 Tax=Candidatus Litorirhabdus singularis TaxID=2518993 RepID=A0ABT3TCU9_9GAMM|nr:mechanosensitive ion channel domain-containing protein [Candidatus Litorirhabdus singularis]MCX2980123.1 mechanosensitive ion channel [Candidatus Litorirhabdus singularis]